MQTCYNCGKQVSDETLICPDCGALVRRYTTPPKREDDPPESAAAPYQMPSEQQQAPHKRAVWREESGRVRFSGLLTFWMVMLILFSGYLALSYGCTLILYHNQDVYAQFLAMIPEFSSIAEIFPELVAVIEHYYPIFAALLLASLVCFVSSIRLLAAKRKAAWQVLLAGGVVICVLMLFVSSLSLELLAIAMLAVTFFWLRPYRAVLR